MFRRDSDDNWSSSPMSNPGPSEYVELAQTNARKCQAPVNWLAAKTPGKRRLEHNIREDENLARVPLDDQVCWLQ